MTDLLPLIQNLLSSRGTTPKESCQEPLAYPRRDWLFAALGALALFVLLAGIDAWLYFGLAEDAAPSSVTATGGGPSQEELRKVLSHYADNATRYQSLLQSAPQVSDPAK